MLVTFNEILFSFLINLGWFTLVFLWIFEDYNDCRKHNNQTFVEDVDLEGFFIIGTIIIIGSAIVSLATIINCVVNNLFTTHNVLLFFGIAFIFLLIILIMKRTIDKNVWHKNMARRENIERKIKIVEVDLKIYEEKLKNYSISKRERETIANYVNVLKDMKEELHLILVSTDIALTVEAVKDIDLQPNTLKILEDEVEKIKSYHSLDEISANINSLMVKYDTKK